MPEGLKWETDFSLYLFNFVPGPLKRFFRLLSLKKKELF